MTVEQRMSKARKAKAVKAKARKREKAKTMSAYTRWLSRERAAYVRVETARGDVKKYERAVADWREVLKAMPRAGAHG